MHGNLSQFFVICSIAMLLTPKTSRFVNTLKMHKNDVICEFGNSSD